MSTVTLFLRAVHSEQFTLSSTCDLKSCKSSLFLQEIASYLISFDRHDEWLSCTLKTRYRPRAHLSYTNSWGPLSCWILLIDWSVCVSGRRTAASSCTTGRRWSTERTDTAGRKGRMERRREKTTWSWRSRAWRSAARARTHLSTAAPPAGRTVSQHSRRNTVCEIIVGGNKMHLLPWTLSLWIKMKLVSTSCFRSVS